MVMWYWYGFVDDDNADVAANTTTTPPTTPNPAASGDIDVDFLIRSGGVVHDDSHATPSSAREFLTTRSFSHTGSVSERLDTMSSSSTTQLHDEFDDRTPASAPAFSSLSLDAADMYTARMRRAKYWLQK